MRTEWKLTDEEIWEIEDYQGIAEEQARKLVKWLSSYCNHYVQKRLRYACFYCMNELHNQLGLEWGVQGDKRKT